MLERHAGMHNGTEKGRDLMATELVTLRSDEHLRIASDLMNLTRVRHMPVVSGGRLVGILSQRDLFRAALSSVLHFRKAAEREWLEKIRVAEVMTTDVVTAGPEWSVGQAVEVMLDRRIGCLPVVERNRLIGLLSETDCLQLLRRMLGVAPVAAVP